MKKNQQHKQIPHFKNEDEEREFWATHSFLDYFDSFKPIVNPIFPNLKPSTETISIRLPEMLLDEIKMIANKKDVPYQSLMKIMLDREVKRERQLEFIARDGERVKKSNLKVKKKK
jgi:predicted DNA binding CopG/RHH family protein